jgi:hypothetical protein
MKPLIVSLFILGAVISISAQKTDSIPYLRVEDPTQIFTSMDVNAGINFERYNWGIEPSFWEFNYRATIGAKNFRTGFILPFNNNSNVNTGLGDIGIDFGYKLHQSKGTYTATTLNAGVFFPTSYNDYYGRGIAWLGKTQPFFTFFGNYTSSLKINKDFYLYPKVEYYQREHIQSGGTHYWSYDTLPNGTIISQVDSVYYPPKQTQNGFLFEVGASYRFNAKQFISGYVGYKTGNWSFRENGYPFLGPSTFAIDNLTFGIQYQYAFSPASQMYMRIDGTVTGINLPSYTQYGYYKDSYFIRLGFRHYLSGR